MQIKDVFRGEPALPAIDLRPGSQVGAAPQDVADKRDGVTAQRSGARTTCSPSRSQASYPLGTYAECHPSTQDAGAIDVRVVTRRTPRRALELTKETDSFDQLSEPFDSSLHESYLVVFRHIPTTYLYAPAAHRRVADQR